MPAKTGNWDRGGPAHFGGEASTLEIKSEGMLLCKTYHFIFGRTKIWTKKRLPLELIFVVFDGNLAGRSYKRVIASFLDATSRVRNEQKTNSVR